MFAEILLILVLYMPEGPVSSKVPQPNIEECWSKAQQFVKLDPHDVGANALAAGCYVKPAHEEKS